MHTPIQLKLCTTSGDIRLQLDQQRAPDTVGNFLQYVETGHYDGTIFHRVIKDFMIQGGGMDKHMNLKSTRASIRNEANNGLNNALGTIAMARTGAPHSACSQFFINTDDNPSLDFQSETREGWGYCVFGKVVEGMETVYRIEKVMTTQRKGHSDVPESPVTLTKATLLQDKT